MSVLGFTPMASVLAVPQTSSFVRLGRHLKPFGPPQPLHPLAVDEPALRLELGGDAPVAKTGMALGEFMETLDQQLVLLGSEGLIPLRTSRLAKHLTDLPFADAQRPPDVADNVPAGAGR